MTDKLNQSYFESSVDLYFKLQELKTIYEFRFLVGAFLRKSARHLQWLVFFSFFSTTISL